MSGYGRRAPNVSQYLANLNHIQPAQDLQQQETDLNALNSDLDFLTNTEFFDFDQFNPPPFDPLQTQAQTESQSGRGHNVKTDPQYQFGEFQVYPATSSTSPTSAASPINLHGQYPAQPQHFAASSASREPRKASNAMPIAADLEDPSRHAAEEDKRRRNTAASARFRVKKKQREQALEKQAKDMSDKVSQLEGKVQQLEMENKWLKELITEKSDIKALEAALDVKREKETEERSTDSRTDGVGTDGKGQEGEA